MSRKTMLCFVFLGAVVLSPYAGWTNYTSQSLFLRDWGITSVAFENDSTVWAATDGGGVVRCTNGQWEVFNRAASPLSGDNVFVICVCADTSGAVWFGTNQGVTVFQNDSTWIQLDTANGLPDNVVSAIARDGSGNKWFGTPAGLCKYDGAAFTEVYRSDTGESVPSVSGITAIVADSQGNIWASGGGGLLKFNGSTCSIFDTLNGLPDTWVRNMMLDGAGKLWLLTGNGIAVFNGTSVIDTLNDPDPLASNLFLSACQDAAGYYWFGTFEHGLLRYDGAHFVRYSVSNGLIDNTVQAIAISDGHVRWIGTPSGMSVFSNDSPRFTRAIADTSLLIGETLFVSLAAADADSDSIFLLIDSGPAGATIEETARRFVWYLASDPGGWPRQVALSVRDPFGGVSRDTFLVNKKPGNGIAEAVLKAPEAFALSQVHPNPANPAASLGYCVPANTGGRVHVSLGVYDLVGRQVAQIVNGPKPQGRYAVTWHGKDDLGRNLASGLYVIRMTAGDFEQQRLFTLLK